MHCAEVLLPWEFLACPSECKKPRILQKEWKNPDFWVFVNFWSEEIPWRADHSPLPSCQINTGPLHELSPVSAALPTLGWLFGLSKELWQLSVSLSYALCAVRCWYFHPTWGQKDDKQAEGQPQKRYSKNNHEFTIHTKRHCYTHKIADVAICICSSYLGKCKSLWFNACDD